MTINLLQTNATARRTSRHALRGLAIWLAIAVWPLAAFGQDAAKAPVETAPLPDVVLFADDPTLEINYFRVFANRPTDCIVESSDESVVQVDHVGYTLMITPVGGVGEATITITARNSAGSATSTLTVTVVDREPATVGELPSTTVTVGHPESVDVASAFAGTNLVFAVASSAEGTATATVTDATVTVAGRVPGDAELTVTAENSVGSATQTMAVTVKDEPPAAVGTLADQALTVGQARDVAVADAFSGSNLVFSVASSVPGAATATLSGMSVLLTPVDPGATVVTVTAENTEGSATQAFTVTVKDQPPAPVGVLDDVTVTVGDTHEVDIADSFDGTNLVFSATSSVTDAATATLSGTSVLLDAVAPGETVVTVMAENTEGSATQAFTVTVKDEPPAAVGMLDDVTLTVGDTHDVDIAGAFRGTSLVFSVSSSAPDMASAAVSGTTVTLAGMVPGSATVTVTAENSEGSAVQTIAVTVRDEPPVAIGTLPDVTLTVADMHDVEVAEAFGGTTLVYSVALSAPDMATASLTGTTMTLTALAAGETTVTVTAENSEGSATQAFSVVVEDQLPMPVGTLSDLTLTVGDTMDVDVAGAFTGSALVYSATSSSEQMAAVDVSGTTVTVAALAAGQVTVTVTAENTAGMATQVFAVAVEDQLPTTIGSLPNVALRAGGDPALVDVAGTFGGTALVYTVSASGDAVSATVAGAQVTVAPLVEGEATVTVTATNSAGVARQSFQATVTTDAAESDALAKGFAAIGASTLSSVTTAIDARFRNGGGAASALAAASAWRDGHRAQRSMWPAMSAFGADNGWLDQSRWQGLLPGPDPAGYGSFNATAAPGVAWQQPARWTFWGHADRQSFDGAGYDGGLTSIYVGADADFGERWLAGVAVSRSVGETGYEFRGAQAMGSGDLETEMLSVFPYVRWSLDDGAEAWAILGFGWGDADHVRTVTAQHGTADVSMLMASFGGRRTLSATDEWEVSLLGDLSLLDMETDGGVGIVNGLNVALSRLRGGLEAGRNIALEGGGMVTWFGQVAARHDGGDGETGGGAELSGGLRYASSGRFGLEAKARILAVHAADDYDENGLSVSAFVRPGPDGEGLSFSLSSHAGSGMGMAGESLVQGYGRSGVDAWRGRDDWVVDARLGYTILDRRLSGSLTPFAEVDVADHRGQTMLGIALDFSGRRALDRLNVEFAGGHGHHQLRGAAGGVFAMRGELRF